MILGLFQFELVATLAPQEAHGFAILRKGEQLNSSGDLLGVLQDLIQNLRASSQPFPTQV